MITIFLVAMMQAPPAAEPKEERKVCRRIEQTASRMGSGRVCKTPSQWRLEKKEAEAFLTEKQHQNIEIQASTAPPAPQ